MTDTTFVVPGASTWEQDMLHHLRDHMAREGAILEEYAYAAEHTRSKALAYVMGILLEDERRHHRWFDELASTLRIDASLSGDDTPIPRLDIDRFDHTALEALVDRLAKNEKDDAKELKRLRKQLHDVEDTTLWTLLVDLMQRDTEKHLEILRFVKKHSRPID